MIQCKTLCTVQISCLEHCSLTTWVNSVVSDFPVFVTVCHTQLHYWKEKLWYVYVPKSFLLWYIIKLLIQKQVYFYTQEKYQFETRSIVRTWVLFTTASRFVSLMWYKRPFILFFILLSCCVSSGSIGCVR